MTVKPLATKTLSTLVLSHNAGSSSLVIQQKPLVGPLSVKSKNSGLYSRNPKSSFRNPDSEASLSKGLSQFFSESDSRLVELNQRLKEQTKDTAKPISEEELLAGMIYNLLRGTEDVRKNIPLAASYLLSDRDPRDVFKIVSQEILPFGVVEYFWPKILTCADPSLSTSFILRSLSVSKVESEFIYNPKWFKRQLQMMNIDSAAELIHGIVLKQGYEEVEELLVLLDEDFQLEIIGLLRLQSPEIYPDTIKVKIGKGYIQRKKAKLFVNPLAVYFERQERELRKLLKSETAGDFFSKDAREKLLKSEDNGELGLEEYMEWERLGAELEIFGEIENEDLKEILLESIRGNIPEGYKFDEDKGIKIITEEEYENQAEQRLYQPDIIEQKKSKGIFGLSPIKDKKTQREKSIFENRAVEQVLLYTYSGQSLYAFHLLKSSSDEVREKVVKLMNEEDLAKIFESVTSYESLLEYLEMEMELSEEELLHGLKILKGFLNIDGESQQEFVQYLFKTARGNHLFKSILRLGMLGEEQIATGLRELYEKVAEKENEENEMEAMSIVEYLVETDSIKIESKKKKLRKQKEDKIESYRVTLQVLQGLSQDQSYRSYVSACNKLALQLKTKEISHTHFRRILPYLLKQLEMRNSPVLEDVITQEKLFNLQKFQSDVHYDLLLAAKQAHKNAENRLLLELKNYQEDIIDEGLKQQLEFLIINKAQPTKSFWRRSEKNLKKMIQARDENSREALQRYLLKSKDLSGMDLRGFDFEEIDLENVDLRGTQLQGVKNISLNGNKLDREGFIALYEQGVQVFQKVDFSGQDLSGLDFKDVYITGANLIDANLENAKNVDDLNLVHLCRKTFVTLYESGRRDFRGCVLNGVDLRCCQMEGCDFEGADLRNSNLKAVNLSKVKNLGSLSGVSLDKMAFLKLYESGRRDFKGVKLAGVKDLNEYSFEEVDFSHADLSLTDFSHSVFTNCNFTGALLDDIKLNFTSFVGCNLYKFKGSFSFKNVKLDRTSFYSCLLMSGRKTFIGVDLRNVDLSDMYLKGINLKEADLRGTNFSRTIYDGSLGKAKINRTSFHTLYEAGRKDFQCTDLTGADLSGLEILAVNFGQAIFKDVILKHSDLRGSLLTGIKGISTIKSLEGVNLDRQSFISLYRSGRRNFRKVNLENVDLYGFYMWSIDFSEANLKGADLRKSGILSTALNGADLTGARFDFRN